MPLAAPSRTGKPDLSRPALDFEPYTPLDFAAVRRVCREFADHIEARREELAEVLLGYESFEVVRDETARTLDLFRSIDENAPYFRLRVGEVASFLPRNQPLYALSCYVAVPALMAIAVHFRIPSAMRAFYGDLLRVLEFDRFFPNAVASAQERLPFLRERCALRLDPRTGETLPVTDAVLFTGTSHHADRLRRAFDPRTLFLTNGAGHNPVVVAEGADLGAAAEAVLTLQLYNQGQDCAAPNAILVHSAVYPRFAALVEEGVRGVKVGPYRDRSCRVGPISDPDDLPRVASLLAENRRWLSPATPGVLRTAEAIVEPTVVCRPLAEGGNYAEAFAPVVFLQRYENDGDLAAYFEHPAYARNAMYLTAYGHSAYARGLVGREVAGCILHDASTYLQDTHLHAPGVERGTRPYGGFGAGASSVRVGGKVSAKPTLPQRDLHEHVALPLLAPGAAAERRSLLGRATQAVPRDVEKLMALRPAEAPHSGDGEVPAGAVYLDRQALAEGGHRYVPLPREHAHALLRSPNAEALSSLDPDVGGWVRELKSRMSGAGAKEPELVRQWLYDLPKGPGNSPEQNRLAQRRFFLALYRLLFGRDEGPRLAEFLPDAWPDAAALLDV